MHVVLRTGNKFLAVAYVDVDRLLHTPFDAMQVSTLSEQPQAGPVQPDLHIHSPQIHLPRRIPNEINFQL